MGLSRVAVDLATGASDDALAREFADAEVQSATPSDLVWPTFDAAQWSAWLRDAPAANLGPELAAEQAGDRADQLARYEIHVQAHLDALLDGPVAPGGVLSVPGCHALNGRRGLIERVREASYRVRRGTGAVRDTRGAVPAERHVSLKMVGGRCLLRVGHNPSITWTKDLFDFPCTDPYTERLFSRNLPGSRHEAIHSQRG